jgi:hypothetical protein
VDMVLVCLCWLQRRSPLRLRTFARKRGKKKLAWVCSERFIWWEERQEKLSLCVQRKVQSLSFECLLLPSPPHLWSLLPASRVRTKRGKSWFGYAAKGSWEPVVRIELRVLASVHFHYAYGFNIQIRRRLGVQRKVHWCRSLRRIK